MRLSVILHITEGNKHSNDVLLNTALFLVTIGIEI